MDTTTNSAVNLNIPNSAYLNGVAVGPATASSVFDPKSLGCPCATPHPEPNPVGQSTVGYPISVGTGNMFEQATDYTSDGANPLAIIRYYNSMGNATGVRTLASALGVNWRSNFDRFLQIGSLKIIAQRANGQQLAFTLNNGIWTSDSDVDLRLTQSGSTWTLSDHDDTTETYTVSGNTGLLQTITAWNGYTQTLTYSGSLLSTVKDSYGRTLTLAYTNAGLLQTVTTPDNTTLTYGFTATSGGSELTSVSFPTTPVATLTYQYQDASFPFAMTAIVDENGQRFTSWTYDTAGRALTSQRGSGAELTTLTYNNNGSTTVTNALGVADTYSFQTLQGVPKVTQIARAATSSTAAATQTFTYDANGFLNSKTDWNGNQTTYVNNVHGDPVTINEAVGTPAARTTTIAYDATWVHLPATVTTSGVNTTYSYDSNGELLTKALTDTTTTTAPYSTAGQWRMWTNTWSNALLASTQTPNGNKTQFGYDGSGALTSIKDALGHSTTITSHTGGGLPLTVVDPNNVTTNLTYDARQRKTSSTVTGSTGTYKTTWIYDAAGNLITTTLPDASYLTNVYDSAHRVTKVTDALGNYMSYTLDALGDRTQTSIYKSDGTLTWQDSGTFDSLGRLLVDTAGAGQATTRSFDGNGNVLSMEDGLTHTIINTYDALNRLSSSTDPNKGLTTPVYDSHDRVVSVTDANNNATSYVRNGFGNVIQQTSPDSGVTVFHYDGDGNMTSKTDALQIVTNQTFDALDRPLTTTYPAHTSENVAYTYDQAGQGFSFGVGHLTSVTDAAGSLTRTYEERGYLAGETRVNGSTGLITAYTYDGAGRVASMTYPDGTLVTYAHDAAGYVSTVAAQLPGAKTSTTLANLTHLPFGPQTAVTYGNGTAENWSYDSDYRAGSIIDSLSGTKLQNLTYAYDNANNVKSITDALNPANTQTLGYDKLNRLTSAVSGTGGYGSFAWTYDGVGNRLTQIAGSTTTSYGYTPGTNRLATISTAVTKGQIGIPSLMKRHADSGIVVSANAPPTHPESDRASRATAARTLPSARIAYVLGWPAMLLGVALWRGSRRRLSQQRLLNIAAATFFAGGAAAVIGCGVTDPNIAAPQFSPAGGAYSSPQTVTVSDASSAVLIYYTTDGSTPTTSSTMYQAPILVSATETIKAIATGIGRNNSPVASATYSINIPTVATPVLSPAGGAFTSSASVSISDTTSGATIYYTLDGTTPTTGSAKYLAPISVTATETINAIAVASGYANSALASGTYTISPPVAATPIFSPSSGTNLTAPQTFTITDATPGATIYYTTDGSAPSANSSRYTSPLTVSVTETIRAIAVASGFTNSAIASVTFAFSPLTSTPVLSPAGGTFTSAQTVTISDNTSGAVIYYTTNGTVPTTGSTVYSGPIAVSSSETISAIAGATGYTTSTVATATYNITLPTAAAPMFSPGAGPYPSTQTVTISDATAGAVIYYTTDGSAPTASSNKYTGPVTVSSSETLSAIALASGYANSAVGSAAYLIAQTAASPTFSPVPGSFTSAQTVTITDTTPGAVVYYTTDGSVPSAGSTKYSGPITVSGTETINAIAVASGYTSSSIATAAYNISLPTAATPSFSLNPGTYNSAQTVTISDTTPGAAIYYTTDGTTPTAASTGYSTPLTVASTEIVKAVAIATGYATSPIASAAYTISTNACLNNVTTNANGNITGVPSADGVYCLTFTYNNANRAASVTGGAMAATYVYDWSGQRFSKTNGGTPPTVYSYASGGTLIAENDNGFITDYVYADGRPVAILQPTATLAANQIDYVVADRLGTPQVVTNTNGSVVWNTTYQPFGTTGLVNASINQNLRLPGQNSDAETGFSYNLNRDYMPNLGRYLETDPLGFAAGPNTFVYVKSNPQGFVDRLGTFPLYLTTVTLGATNVATSTFCGSSTLCNAVLGSSSAAVSELVDQASDTADTAVSWCKIKAAAAQNFLAPYFDRVVGVPTSFLGGSYIQGLTTSLEIYFGQVQPSSTIPLGPLDPASIDQHIQHGSQWPDYPGEP